MLDKQSSAGSSSWGKTPRMEMLSTHSCHSGHTAQTGQGLGTAAEVLTGLERSWEEKLTSWEQSFIPCEVLWWANKLWSISHPHLTPNWEASHQRSIYFKSQRETTSLFLLSKAMQLKKEVSSWMWEEKVHVVAVGFWGCGTTEQPMSPGGGTARREWSLFEGQALHYNRWGLAAPQWCPEAAKFPSCGRMLRLLGGPLSEFFTKDYKSLVYLTAKELPYVLILPTW